MSMSRREEPQVEIPVKEPGKPARPVQAPGLWAGPDTSLHAPVQTRGVQPPGAGIQAEASCDAGTAVCQKEAEQVPAKPDGQDDDFEIFDL